MARAKSIGGRHPIGEYADVVTVQQQATGSAEWVDVVMEAPARVAAVSTWQRLQSAQLEDAIEYRAALHGLSGAAVTAGMRVLWLTSPTGTAVLMIRNVVHDGFDLVCECVGAHA